MKIKYVWLAVLLLVPLFLAPCAQGLPPPNLQELMNQQTSSGTITVEGNYTAPGIVTIPGNRKVIFEKSAFITIPNNFNNPMFVIGDNVEIELNGVLDGNRDNQTDPHIVFIEAGNNFRIHGSGKIQNVLGYSLSGLNKTDLIAEDITFSNVGRSTCYFTQLRHSKISGAFIGSYLTSIEDVDMSGIIHGGCYLTNGQSAVGNRFTPVAGAYGTAINVEYANNGLLKDIDIFRNYSDGTGANSWLGLGLTPNSNNVIIENIKVIYNTFKNG